MCGISGIVNFPAEQSKIVVKKMIDSMHHRGPDGSGMHESERCVFGHNRLSIVDLESGHQPMKSHDGRYVITFNGEIYGYQDLKANTLYPYATSSDTELILALYIKYGQELPKYLPGMFAIAIWDTVDLTLFCCRDRFGEKPFYYSVVSENRGLIFASEMKAILSTGLTKKTINQYSLDHYLINGYVPSDKSIYSDIHVLAPGHALFVSNHDIKTWAYWSVPESTGSLKLSLEEGIEEFNFLFSRAVQKQLVADVEVGAFLSGGLDSSTVVSEAVNWHPTLRTYSFEFQGDLSETEYSTEVAKEFKTNHLVLREQDQQSLAELVLEANKVYDEPFSDSSYIPTYQICKLAREYGKVALTGDGADELLGGYTSWYQPLLQYSHPGSLSLSLSKARAGVEYLLAKSHLSNSRIRRDRYQMMKAQHLGSTLLSYYRSRKELSVLLAKHGVLIDVDSYTKIPETGTVQDALNDDLIRYMPGDILVKTDRAAMANSLELRAPFLDADLANFLIKLSPDLKINSNEGKWLMRKAKEGILPKKVLKRGKQGFGASIDVWKTHPDLMELKENYVNDPKRKVYQYVGFDFSKNLMKEKPNYFWDLLNLSLWFENYH